MTAFSHIQNWNEPSVWDFHPLRKKGDDCTPINIFHLSICYLDINDTSFLRQRGTHYTERRTRQCPGKDHDHQQVDARPCYIQASAFQQRRHRGKSLGSLRCASTLINRSTSQSWAIFLPVRNDCSYRPVNTCTRGNRKSVCVFRQLQYTKPCAYLAGLSKCVFISKITSLT